MKVILSPRQRFELAALFVNDKLVLADLAEMKVFNRTRLSLGLSPIMDLLVRRQPLLASTVGSNVAATFQLDTAGASWILHKIVPLTLTNSYLAMLLGAFFEICETGGVADAVAMACPPPPADESWAPPAAESLTLDQLRGALLLPAAASIPDVLARVDEICTRG